MPIRPEQRPLYPADWKAISREIRERASWRCEGSPAFPACRAANGEPHPDTGSIVVLTVAHLDHNPANNDRLNLRCLCQRGHLTYDAAHHARNAATKRREKLGNMELPL